LEINYQYLSKTKELTEIKELINKFLSLKNSIIPQKTKEIKGIDGFVHMYLLSMAADDFILSQKEFFNLTLFQEEKIDFLLEALKKEKDLGYQNLAKILENKSLVYN
jgi:hypothetical protein